MVFKNNERRREGNCLESRSKLPAFPRLFMHLSKLFAYSGAVLKLKCFKRARDLYTSSNFLNVLHATMFVNVARNLPTCVILQEVVFVSFSDLNFSLARKSY